MRRLLDRTFLVASGLCAAAACSLLLALAGFLLWKAAPALSWDFVLSESREAGAGGGVLYQLVGTGILVATALAVCLPVAVGVGLLRGLYLPPGSLRRRLDLVLYTLNGVPSVLFGIFGLLFLVHALGWGKSWLAGGLVLGFMILPTVTVALVERIDALPRKYLEAAAGLGLSRSQIAWAVVLPQSAGGLASGVLLGLARAAGETAPILFTAAVFSGVALPDGVVESPVLALPYHIFVLAQDSLQPGAGERLWGAAAVLLGVAVSLSLAALPARLGHREASRG